MAKFLAVAAAMFGAVEGDGHMVKLCCVCTACGDLPCDKEDKVTFDTWDGDNRRMECDDCCTQVEAENRGPAKGISDRPYTFGEGSEPGCPASPSFLCKLCPGPGCPWVPPAGWTPPPMDETESMMI